MAPLLSLTEVTRRHMDGRRAIVVLDKVSLEIDHGDYVGIWGPKRSGKSTLLRIMAGMEEPDAGAVRFDGELIGEMSARRRARLLRTGGIALVSSDWRPQIVRPVVEIVAAACASDGTPMREARIRARQALARVKVSDCADLLVNRLALSERLRMAIAVALVREPRLLLIDEPAVLPSPMESEELYALLRSLGEERAPAVAVASEDLAPLGGTRRKMVVSSGEVRSMDSRAVIVPFPEPPPRDSHSTDAAS